MMPCCRFFISNSFWCHAHNYYDSNPLWWKYFNHRGFLYYNDFM